MSLLDLLGRRGALRILWELREKPLTFRALLEAAETNPAGLNTRLKELREAGIVLLNDEGYALSGDGKSLLSFLLPLHSWAETWARQQRKPAK